MNLTQWIEIAAELMEGAGVLTMVVGAVFALVSSARRARAREAEFHALRTRLGQSILLGLEFLVAADIIRTVTTTPTLGQVTVLAIVVAIRTFLSFTLQLELEGRWPWQKVGR